MSIKVACECGRVVVTRDGYAGKWVRCPACRTALMIPVSVPVPDGTKRSAWKDPIVVVGSLVPTAVVVGFAFYLYRDWSDRDFSRRVTVAKAAADKLATTGNVVRAVEAYERIL
jgi:hypothetical protein